MKRTVELVFLCILYLLLGAFIINRSDERSIFMLLYTSTLFVSIGGIFFGNLYYLLPLFRNGFIKRFLILNTFLLFTAYSLSAFLYASWMAEVSGIEVLLSHLIHPTIFKDIMPLLVSALLLSFLYSGLKHLVLTERFLLLKKIMAYTISVFTIIGAGFLINLKMDLDYEGDKQTLFIDRQYNTLDEVVQLPQFRNKVVYVDLWYSSCGPCIKEFKHMASLKENLKGKEVEYLYLARETSHPNSMQRWKNAVRKYNLQGWHVYMSKRLEQEVWNSIAENQRNGATAIYPKYLLLDRNGRFVSFDAKRPSSGKDLVEEIEALL